MFCSNCGKNLPDGAKFCDGCGAQQGAAAPAAPAARPQAAPAAQANPMVDNTVKVFKGFFSKNPVRTVECAAKSTTLEWVLLALVSILAYSFAIAANVGQLIGQLISPEALPYLYNFGTWFLYGLLFSAIGFAALSFATFLSVKIATNAFVDIKSVFNVTAVGLLPLACAYLANILLGFIWAPIAALVSICGVIASIVYMYSGVKKLASFEKEPFLTYTIAWSAAVIVTVVIAYLVIYGGMESLAGSMAGRLF